MLKYLYYLGFNVLANEVNSSQTYISNSFNTPIDDIVMNSAIISTA